MEDHHGYSQVSPLLSSPLLFLTALFILIAAIPFDTHAAQPKSEITQSGKTAPTKTRTLKKIINARAKRVSDRPPTQGACNPNNDPSCDPGSPPSGGDIEWLDAGGRCDKDLVLYSNGPGSPVAAKFEPCWRAFRRNNDRDLKRDYYVYQMSVVGQSDNAWTLTKMKTATSAYENASQGYGKQTWVDYAPKTDQFFGGCESPTLTVGVTSAEITLPIGNACEVWKVRRPALPAVSHEITWEGSSFGFRREVGFLLAVSVPQGTLAEWETDLEVKADCYAWNNC
jgi:hypothetical protein